MNISMREVRKAVERFGKDYAKMFFKVDLDGRSLTVSFPASTYVEDHHTSYISYILEGVIGRPVSEHNGNLYEMKWDLSMHQMMEFLPEKDRLLKEIQEDYAESFFITALDVRDDYDPDKDRDFTAFELHVSFPAPPKHPQGWDRGLDPIYDAFGLPHSNDIDEGEWKMQWDLTEEQYDHLQQTDIRESLTNEAFLNP